MATTYTRLPGAARKPGFVVAPRCTLWMATDHVLSVSLAGCRETYKRFYYRDIQAIVIRTTLRGRILNFVLVLFAALSALFFLVGDRAADITGAILVGFWLALLLVNWLRGPTCVSHAYTAVQRDELGALQRLRVARKVIALLRPAILEAQRGAGAATPEAGAAGGTAAVPAPEAGIAAFAEDTRAEPRPWSDAP